MYEEEIIPSGYGGSDFYGFIPLKDERLACHSGRNYSYCRSYSNITDFADLLIRPGVYDK
jgi:hypothetical protein